MARVNSVAGHAVEQHSSPNVGGEMDAHQGLVLHIAEGTYKGTINWQMNPDQRYASGGTVTTSSTWVVGREPGEIAQMADSDRVAWCQRGGSRTWNSVELAGYAPNPPTAWQIEACAHLLVWLHQRYGVPLQVATTTTGRGLGHHSMDNDTTVEWGHDSCPGSGVINAKSRIVARAREILAGTEDDMATFTDAHAATLTALGRVLPELAAQVAFTDGRLEAAANGRTTVRSDLKGAGSPMWLVSQLQVLSTKLDALVTAGQGATVDEVARYNSLVSRLNELAEAEADRDAELRQLLAEHASGQLDAEAVVRRMGEMLAASGTAEQPPTI